DAELESESPTTRACWPALGCASFGAARLCAPTILPDRGKAHARRPAAPRRRRRAKVGKAHLYVPVTWRLEQAGPPAPHVPRPRRALHTSTAAPRPARVPNASDWDAHFEHLTAYLAAHGDCAVPFIFVAADGAKLGVWVNTQRRAYKKGTMSPERVERLKAVAFVWDVHASWDAHFELLTAYHAAHGDCAVPFIFAAADGTKLG
ncbi:helicase associated domain-containing protein, partial [Pelagophyceae sp. CCMP2097]